MSKPDAAERLGTEPVGKLLLKFSIPSIAGMLLNALYNVVDRIFVGRGVDEIALGGISLIMPLMTLSMAFAMLFGLGAANMISMRLGQGRRGEAQSALNLGFLLLLTIGILTSLTGLALLEPILSLLGAQEDSVSLDYARRYYKIILYGQTFFQLGFGLSHCSRAQGFPIISMIGMFIGAGLNTILDPIFIFVFKWGVEGAAYATIISQIASAVWVLYFCASKKAVVRLSPKDFKPSFVIFITILSFGSAPSLLQFAMSAIQLLLNSSMGWYGAEGLGVANGGDVALSAMNIIGSIAMLILMPVFGINQGAQPVMGFNYGAKKFARVRRAYLLAVSAATVICTAGFIATQFFPRQIVSLFAPNGSEALLSFTPWAMRVFTMILCLNGVQIVSSNMFVVTGRPKISIFLSMLRQVIILIPCLFLFGHLWGLRGVVFATPVADLLSLFVTVVMVAFELKKLKSDSNTAE